MLIKQAYCDSRACVFDQNNLNSTSRVLKNVKVGTIECPDCRAVLFWKSPKRNLTMAERKKEKKRQQSEMKREYFL